EFSLHIASRPGFRIIKTRQLKRRVALAIEEIRLIHHPVKHEVARPSVAELHDAPAQPERLDVALHRPLQLDDLGDAPEIAHEIEDHHLVLVWADAQAAAQLLNE